LGSNGDGKVSGNFAKRKENQRQNQTSSLQMRTVNEGRSEHFSGGKGETLSSDGTGQRKLLFDPVEKKKTPLNPRPENSKRKNRKGDGNDDIAVSREVDETGTDPRGPPKKKR